MKTVWLLENWTRFVLWICLFTRNETNKSKTTPTRATITIGRRSNPKQILILITICCSSRWLGLLLSSLLNSLDEKIRIRIFLSFSLFKVSCAIRCLIRTKLFQNFFKLFSSQLFFQTVVFSNNCFFKLFSSQFQSFFKSIVSNLFSNFFQTCFKIVSNFFQVFFWAKKVNKKTQYAI